MAIKDENLLKCPKCQGTWFEQRIFFQVDDSITVILGQKVPPKGAEFLLLVCGKCGEMLEPRLLRSPRDNIDRQYDKFYDELNKEVSTDSI